MTITPAFFGHVTTNGKLILDDRSGFVAHTWTFAGQAVELSIRKKRSKRSLDQNAWLWGVALPLIADHCGYDQHEHDMLHYELLAKRFGTVEVTSHLPGAQPFTMPAQTTSKMNTKEFSEYMEWLVRFAATELGVEIPLPNEVA